MKSPFKFLDSYTIEDREIFFGRENEIEELYHRVFESKIMLVYGVSGTGKSSLIHCGLANKFQETDWLPLVVRRGGNIIDNLALAIRTASLTPQTGQIITPLNFRKAVRSLYLDHYKPIFIIFDQFEELFIFGNKDEKRSFIQTIKSIVESDIQCRFIFVMREEYMASFTEFERYIPAIFQNRVRIEKMSHLKAIEAIKGPCKFAGIEIEEGFAETLLEKLSPASGDVELTYLQVFLDRIFKLAAHDNPVFNIQLLNQVGDVSDLLGSFLDEQISLLSDPETGLAVLKSFVSVKGTKQAMSIEQVQDYILTLGSKPDTLNLSEMIQSFVSLRILCDKDQHDRYELRHDALAAKIFEKFTLAEKELLEVRKFVENAYYTFETRGILLNRDDLDYLAGYGTRLILPVNLAEFIAKSKAKILLHKKTLVRITRLSAFVFVIMVAAILRQTMGRLTAISEKVQIGSALLQAESDPVACFENVYGLWSKYKNSTLLKKIILTNYHKLLNADSVSSKIAADLQKLRRPIVLPKEIREATISAGGEFIFGWLSDNSIFILNPLMNVINKVESAKSPLQITFSASDSLIAVVYTDSSGLIEDFRGRIKYTFKTTPNEINNRHLLCFLPGKNSHLAVSNGNVIDIYDRSGRIIMNLKGHRDRINGLDISPDGRFLASASCDKKVIIWNSNSEQNQFNLYDSLVGHRDTVWSCQFNSNSNYILTASADSTQRIWNLLGKEVNTSYYFTRNSEKSPREKAFNLGIPDDDAYNPFFSLYYRKSCDAIFSKDQLNIISTSYTQGKGTKADPDLNKVLFFDFRSKFYTQYYTEFMDMAHSDENNIRPQEFKNLILSPSGDLAACELQNAGEIYLVATDGLRVLKINGTSPMFSEDGNYLFWINGNTISSMPASPEEILKILNKNNLFKHADKSADNLVGI